MRNEKSSEKNRPIRENIRKIVDGKRKNLPQDYREKSSRIIAEQFLKTDYYASSKNILIYYPIKVEVDTKLIINKALKDKKNIILPRVHNDKLKLFFVEDPSSQLEKGSYGIMEPIINLCKPAKIHDADLVVIPGVSFDKDLNRLGYGGGYYDKILENLPKRTKKIALCFNIQLVSKIPAMDHDVRADILITEARTYHPGQSTGFLNA